MFKLLQTYLEQHETLYSKVHQARAGNVQTQSRRNARRDTVIHPTDPRSLFDYGLPVLR